MFNFPYLFIVKIVFYVLFFTSPELNTKAKQNKTNNNKENPNNNKTTTPPRFHHVALTGLELTTAGVL